MLIGPNMKDVIQHVALAFSTSLLYLMVQPRPEVVDESLAKGDAGYLFKINTKVHNLELIFSHNLVQVILYSY